MMKRITAFMAVLFLVLGSAATNNFAQDNMMKQQNTMTKQTDMMSGEKPMMKKRSAARKPRKTYHHRPAHKTMMKKSTVK